MHELTDLVNLDNWPDETRLIIRRERAHPGAQLSLFDDINGWRHTCFITNRHGDIVRLEMEHRQRGTAESVIRDFKACGGSNLPFSDIVNNTIWATLAAGALSLLSWVQRLTLTGPLATATPKTIRYKLLHTAAQASPANRNLHLDHNWPWTPTILTAINRLNTLIPPPTVTNQAA